VISSSGMLVTKVTRYINKATLMKIQRSRSTFCHQENLKFPLAVVKCKLDGGTLVCFCCLHSGATNILKAPPWFISVSEQQFHLLEN
jgi:hypothetical protein